MKKRTLLSMLMATMSTSAIAAPEVPYELCKESFSYLGVQYQGTTDRNNSGSQWCYLKSGIDGSTWGNVRTESIPQFKTITGKSCMTPSSYLGEEFYGCSTRGNDEPWCYVAEGSWEVCEQPEPPELLAHTHPKASDRLDSVAFGSCFKPQGDMSEAMAKLVKQQPDLFVWLGDNIYADTRNMSVMRQKYDDKKSDPDYRKFLEAKIPVMGTWDDHDYGENNDGKYYPQRENSQKEYLRHFDVSADDPRLNGREGIYEAKMLGGAGETTHVITLDARYFRSPTFAQYADGDAECEGTQSSMLGEVQWQWLEKELQKPSEIKVIASAIQVLPPLYQERSRSDYCAYGDGKAFEQAIVSLKETEMSGTYYESWAEMPVQRERLLRLVQQSVNQGKTKAVVFISGDQHWGELMQKTIPASEQFGAAVTVHEVTASGFGQNWPIHIENPLRLPVYADNKGDGNYNKQCQIPFSYGGITYHGCTSRDHDQPWCYTEVNDNGTGIAGEWGNCAPSGATIPTGRVGVVSENINSLTTSNRHIINKSGSNYGLLDIDWQNREIKMSIESADEEAVSTVIKF